jgi:hypothetical protein
MRALNPRIITKLISFLLIVSLVIIACASTPTAAPNTQVSVPTAVINPPDTPPPTTTPTPPSPPEQQTPSPIKRTQYKLDVFFDYPTRSLSVEQTIQYLNQTGETLTGILLVVEPQRYSGVFQLDSLTWGSGEYVGLYTLENGILDITLPAALPPGESLHLSINYTLQIPLQPGAFGYTARQTNLADWYPYVPPYRAGDGWLVNTPGLVGEHQLYDIADYEVIIRSPEPGLTLAASVPAQPAATGSFYQLEAARGFIWSASLEYVGLQEYAGETLLTAYVFPEHRSAGESALQTMAAALPFYESLFGAYPRASLTLIEADFYDGYESDGAFFLDEVYFWDHFKSPNNYLTTLAAHETAHQWWYAQVGNDPAIEPWLDEALATYSEFLFYEYLYPDQTGWWWQFRVARYNPSGFINSAIYDYTDIDVYVYAVYLRGASFLRDLRVLIGDDTFFAFLQDYASQGHHRLMTSQDFFTILAKHSDADLSILLGVYFTEDS